MINFADLHIHSTYSDGFLSPEDIAKAAIKQGIKCISITDHDTISSQYIAKKIYNDLKIITGVEFSTEYKGEQIHILGYFIDTENKALIEAISNIQTRRTERVEEILKKLAQNQINVELDYFKTNSSTSFGRGNIARELVSRGYAKTFKEAFLKYLDVGRPAYVEVKKLNYIDVINLIHDSSGIPVLAHPGKIHRSMGIEEMIKEFKNHGLNGMEVYHTSHTSNQISTYYNLSKKYKLLITGGSDFHGRENAKISIGNSGINEELYNKLIYFKHRTMEEK